MQYKAIFHGRKNVNFHVKVNNIFLIFALKHRFWVLTINVLSKNKKNIIIFHVKINIFTTVKYCCILHGRVCVMLGFMESVHER